MKKVEKEILNFRRATADDIPSAAAILRAAARRMMDEGKNQWSNDYPTEIHVAADVKAGVGYVLVRNDEVVAYGAVIFSGEPAYENIQGRWLSEGNYIVLHRIGVLPQAQVQGIGLTFMTEVEKLALSRAIKSFRVDTNYDNERMLGLIKKAGFKYCGEVFYERGARMAFEKLLPG